MAGAAGAATGGYGMSCVRIVQLSLAEWPVMFSFCRPFILCAVWALLWAAPAWADTVVIARRIDVPGVSLQDVHAQLAPGSAADTVQISLRAARADIPQLGWRRVGVVVEGNLHRDVQMRWMFDGTMQLIGAPGGALGNATLSLSLDVSANTLEINAI